MSGANTPSRPVFVSRVKTKVYTVLVVIEDFLDHNSVLLFIDSISVVTLVF